MTKQKIYLLHGWITASDTQDKWQPFIKLMAEKGYYPVFLKIPGLTTKLDQPWNLDNYVHWLESQLKSEKEVILLGHSFGGQLAIKYSALHQEQIEKLILIGPAGIRDNSEKKQLKRIIFALLAKIGKVVAKFLPGKQFFRWLLYKLAREQDYYNCPPELRRTMANVINEDISNLLTKVKAETLLIWGSEDKAAPFENSKIFEQRIDQCHLVSIRNAWHSPQYTHTKQVVQIVSNFLQKT